MSFLSVLLRLAFWVGLPVLLVAVVIGPRRFVSLLCRGRDFLFARRLEPEVLLADVVRQHQEHVAKVRRALEQAVTAESEIARSLATSQTNIRELETEAQCEVRSRDELGAKAALYKLNLERDAAANYQTQLDRQQAFIEDSRRRLYLAELQLRQFEVGRTILMSQLAQAKSLEQQYEIASSFDPFNAVANWQKAAGLVQEKALLAQAKERVAADTADLAANHAPDVDAATLEHQLDELKRLCQTDSAAPSGNGEPLRDSNKQANDHSQQAK